MAIRRYRCRFTGRTFSLLPDGLLPYRYYRTATIVRALRDVIVQGRPLARCARRRRLHRCTVRGFCRAFLRTVPHLRLPTAEGALAPADFVRRLLGLGAASVVALLRFWKELEPKHSLLGFYRR